MTFPFELVVKLEYNYMLNVRMHVQKSKERKEKTSNLPENVSNP